MIIKNVAGQDTTLHVHSGGYLYYTGRELQNEILSVTMSELARMDIKTDPKTNRLYIQKGGQKRLYVDNAVITDIPKQPCIKDYLAKQGTYEVTITLKQTIDAPDKSFANLLAEELLRIQDKELTDSAQYSIHKI